jgi:hypothetical protein
MQLIALGVEDFLLFNYLDMISDVGTLKLMEHIKRREFLFMHKARSDR